MLWGFSGIASFLASLEEPIRSTLVDELILVLELDALCVMAMVAVVEVVLIRIALLWPHS